MRLVRRYRFTSKTCTGGPPSRDPVAYPPSSLPRSTPPADGSVAALVWASVPLDQSNRDGGLALARQIRLAVEAPPAVR